MLYVPTIINSLLLKKSVPAEKSRWYYDAYIGNDIPQIRRSDIEELPINNVNGRIDIF